MRRKGRINYFVAALLCTGMTLGITGCGGDGDTQTENAGSVQTAEAEMTETTEVESAAEEPDAASEQEPEPEQATVQDPQDWAWDEADEQTLRYAFACRWQLSQTRRGWTL